MCGGGECVCVCVCVNWSDQVCVFAIANGGDTVTSATKALGPHASSDDVGSGLFVWSFAFYVVVNFRSCVNTNTKNCARSGMTRHGSRWIYAGISTRVLLWSVAPNWGQ